MGLVVLLGNLFSPSLIFQGCKVKITGELLAYMPTERKSKAVSSQGPLRDKPER